MALLLLRFSLVKALLLAFFRSPLGRRALRKGIRTVYGRRLLLWVVWRALRLRT
ncbi:MAG TPA: hypothetical protein VFU30_00290 [Gaiellaceae bacterium]|nr:hypothetical protein [Gaiellaceae bacterium]